MPIHDNKGRNPVPELGDTSGYYPDGKPQEPTQAEIEAFKAAMAEEVTSKISSVEKEGNEARKRVMREMARKLQRVEFFHSFDIKEKKVEGPRGGESVLAINLDHPILPTSVKAVGEADGIVETRKKVTPGEVPGGDAEIINPDNILVIEVESTDVDPLEIKLAKHVNGAGPVKPGITIPVSEILVVPVAHLEGPEPNVHVTVSQETRGGDFDLSRGDGSRTVLPEEPVSEDLPIHNVGHSFFAPANSKIKPFFRKSETENRIPEGNPYAFPVAPLSRTVELPETRLAVPTVHGKTSIFADGVGAKPLVRLSENAPLDPPVSKDGQVFFAGFEQPVPETIPEGRVIPEVVAIPEGAVIPLAEGIPVPEVKVFESPVIPPTVAAVVHAEIKLPVSGHPDLPVLLTVDGQPLPESKLATVDPVLAVQDPVVRTVDSVTVPDLHVEIPEGIVPAVETKAVVLSDAPEVVSLAVVPDSEFKDVEAPDTHIHLKPIEHEENTLLVVPEGVSPPVELRAVESEDPAVALDPSAIVPDSIHQALVFGEINAPGFPEFVVSEGPDHRPAEQLVIRAEGGTESHGAGHHEQPPLLREGEDADFRIGKADRKRAVEIDDDKSGNVPDAVMQAGALYRLHAGEDPLQAAFHYQAPVQQGHTTPLTQEVVSMVDRLLVTADSGSYVKEVRMTLNDSVLPNTEIQFRQVGNSLTVTLINEDGRSLDLLRKEAPELAEALRSRTGDEVEVKIITGVGAGASEETV